MTPQEFKENYEFVKGQMAAGGWDYDPDAYPVNAAWTKIVKYIDSKSAPSGEEDKPARPAPVFVPPRLSRTPSRRRSRTSGRDRLGQQRSPCC